MQNALEQPVESIPILLRQQEEHFDQLHQKGFRADRLAVSKLHHLTQERQSATIRLLVKLFKRLEKGLLERYQEAERAYLKAVDDLNFNAAQIEQHAAGRSEASDLRAYIAGRGELEAERELLAEVVAEARPRYERLQVEVMTALRKTVQNDAQNYHEERQALHERHRQEKEAQGAVWMPLQGLSHMVDYLPLAKLLEKGGIET